mgnify:CR=1 FL=1
MSDSESEVHEPVEVGLQVQYCGACTMPLEYCEFSPTYATDCLVWRREHCPDDVSDGVEKLALEPKRKEKASSKASKSRPRLDLLSSLSDFFQMRLRKARFMF